MTESITIGIGEFCVATAPVVLKTYGLGSCIGIAVYDPATRTGALAHTLLPHSADGAPASSLAAKFTDRAVDLMVAELLKSGCAGGRLVAKLAGGASMFDALFQSFRGDIGARNVAAARERLQHHGIRLLAEDTGADYGRSIEFDTATGEMVVRALQRETRTI